MPAHGTNTQHKVVEYNKPYQVNKIRTPDPSGLGPYDLLVKVAVASYCHTDSMIQSGIFGTALPVIASHEGAGTVVAAGSSSELKPGDRVMCGLPFHPCGKCPECTGPNEGWRQYCESVEGHCGVHRDGFFAEYALCDARTSTKLPNEISLLSAAPLACAGRTVWRGVEQAGLKEGQWLAIVGSGGGLGHLGVQFAKKKGLKVIGIDARDDGLQVSAALGADFVIDARKGEAAVVGEVHKATRDANPGNPGVDATVTLSDAPTAAALGCAITKRHATMVQIAQPKDVVIPFSQFVFRDVTVKGSVVSSPGESNAMVRFIAETGIKVKTNIFYGLDQIEKLIDMVHGGKIQGKAVIVIDKEQIAKEEQLGAKY
ncbi:hypothetical protein INS49_003246 [Diaporthe citri]|uniref:uncharacterized protein n=1 Tax=Diaporthe citri TaxID=83186 RepID=UPI001C7E84FC|nr:uncharacterized protein INS49_003246 [Diaporthe citri]KAG6355285.1 hypothetical protein INS49_003246 [Diaporthe citri]